MVEFKAIATVILSGVTAACVTYILNSRSRSKDIYREKLEGFYLQSLEIENLMAKNLLLIDKVCHGIEDVEKVVLMVKENRQEMLKSWIKINILKDLYVKDGEVFASELKDLYQKGHAIENEFLACKTLKTKRQSLEQVLSDIIAWEEKLRGSPLISRKYL